MCFKISVFPIFAILTPSPPPPLCALYASTTPPPVPGKESVGVDASGPATRKTLLPAKGAESEKEGSRAKSAHSKLDSAHQAFGGYRCFACI